MGRAQIAFAQLEQCHPVPILALLSIDEDLGHAARQLDQVERRLLKGETIPQNQKVFSIFEPHTRWVVKGKAGVPVELGVPVCVVEDQFQFLLHHKIMWQGHRCGCGGVDGGGNTGLICRFSHVQFRPGISLSEQSPAIGRDAGAQCAAAQGLFEPGGAGARTRTRSLRRCADSIRPWSRRSTILSIEVWSGCAVMVPVVLSIQLRWRWWLPTYIALVCCCSAESAKSSDGGKRRVCAPPEAAASNSATARTLPFRRERLPMPVFWGMASELTKSLPNGLRCRLFDSLHCEK